MEPSSGYFREVSVLPSPEGLVDVRISCSSSSREPRGWLGMGAPPALLPLAMVGRGPKAPARPAETRAGAAAGGGNSHWGLTLLRDSLCTAGLCERRQKVRLSQNLDRVCKRSSLWLFFSLRNRFFPLRTQKIDSLAGRIAEASHVQMVCTSAFFTALV